MKNFDKYLLFSYISYISIFILIFIIGITGVFAASYTGFDYSAQLFDNVNGNLSSVTTAGPTAGTGAYEGYIAYSANSSGGAWGISSPTTLLANHTYTLTASIPNECGSLVLSTYNRIGVGTSLSNAKTSYQNNTNVTEIYSKVIGGNNFLIQFAFTPTTNGSFIVFPYATTKSCSSSRTFLESISIEDLGLNGATQDDINNSLNSQTNEINTTINNMGSDIRDSIKDTFEDCRKSNNLLNLGVGDFSTIGISQSFDNSTVIFNGTSTNSGEFFRFNLGYFAKGTYTYYIQLKSGSFNVNGGAYAFYIDGSSDGRLIEHEYHFPYRNTFTLNEDNPNLSFYGYINKSGISFDNAVFNIMISKGSNNLSFEPYGEICSNKIDETNNQLGDLNNSLNNSDSSGATNDASNFFSNFTTDTFGLTSIITAPLSLINNLTSSSCSTLRLPLPYLDNKYLDLPCMETIYTKYFGSFFTIYQTITFGIVAYWVIVRIFNQVKDFKNPDHDEIEVLDL